MSRIRTFVTVMLPSMLAGGFLFGAAFSHAASNDSDGFWPNPAPVIIAQADPPKKAPPVAPVPPPAPPRGPKPPQPPKPAGGISVSIDHGTLQLTGVREMVKAQLVAARARVSSDPRIPADLKKSILARIDKVDATVQKRLSKLSLTDLDQLDDEMEKMGEELEEAFDGFEDDLEKLGKNFKIDLGNLHFDHDDDEDDIDIPSAPDVGDADDSDMRDAINDLKDLALTSQQRDQITKLRTESDKHVAAEKKQIEELSEKLRTSLGNSGVTDADIGKLVDQISGHEASMRKARIVAWAQARRVLDAAQRKKVEDAAAKAKVKTKTK